MFHGQYLEFYAYCIITFLTTTVIGPKMQVPGACTRKLGLFPRRLCTLTQR
jgi:hypothetical protein